MNRSRALSIGSIPSPVAAGGGRRRADVVAFPFDAFEQPPRIS
jgi:hypothetical protein